MSTPRFDELPYLPWPGAPFKPGEDYTVEAWVNPQGVITDFRLTRGYARYGRLPWWRRLLAHRWPWLHIRFQRTQQGPSSDPFMNAVTLLQRFNSSENKQEP